jgi:1,2-phenylacetyl-CoA epoxidase catalytic subunit
LIREERYHVMHAGAWLDRLARDEGEARDRLVAAMTELSGDAATVFTPLEGETDLVFAGVLDEPMNELEARWRASITPILAALDLPMPRPADDLERGRREHGAEFAWLWGEFTSVRRADPGATW